MNRNNELAGKVAIVTGSARNIGKAMAEELASAGAAVVINAQEDYKACENVTRNIVNSGGKAISVEADISDQAGVDHLIFETSNAFGRIDFLILNAAIRIDTSFLDRSFDDWRRAMKVAVDGSFRLSIGCVPFMIARGGGAIVGIHGMQAYTSAYGKNAATKDAQAGLLRGMARDLGKYKITCNIAVVGSFETDRLSSSGELEAPNISKSIPLVRLGIPQDVANCIRFLVGPFATYISGQIVHLNGAYHMPH